MVGLMTGTTIPAMSTCTLQVDLQGTAAGEHCNRIVFNAVIGEVQTSPPTGTSNEDVAEACVEVIDDPIFDLALRKTLADGQASMVTVGSTVNFTITVFNQGTTTATDVQVTEYVPDDFTLGATDDWTVSGGNVVLVNPIASIAPGEEVEINVPLIISPSFTGEFLVNRAEISSANGGTDIDSDPDNIEGNDKGGSVGTPSDDVVLGNAKLPGGTPNDTNGLTDEDDEDPAIVFIEKFVNPNCYIALSADPGDCETNDNTYNLSGTLTFGNAPTTGTLTVAVDGVIGQTFNAPFSSPQAFSVSSLDSDGQQHSIVVQFSADAACQSSMEYNAPDPCEDPGDCTVSITAMAGDCDENTNTYDVSGQITFTDAPASGTMTVTVGAFQQTFNAPFISPANYNITGLLANGSGNTVIVSFSENMACRNTADYVAPAGCDPVECGVTVTAVPGNCNNATNTYDVDGEVTFTNAPTTGTLTVSIAGINQVFNAPFTSPQAYTISGLIADGSNQMVTASFSDDISCLAEVDYTAPSSCSPGVCAVSLEASPSPCSNGSYTLSGAITLINPPTTGTLTVFDGISDLLTIALPSGSPISFNLPNLPADGFEHTLRVVFSEDINCTNSFTYMAPDDCTGICDIMATVSNVNCADSGTPLDPSDDYITFELNPTGTNLGTGYTVSANSGMVSLLSGGVATNVAYGVSTTFRMQNGAAGSGNVSLTITDATNPSCSDNATLIDPGVCSEPECTMVLTAEPGDCIADALYDLTGRVFFTNPPNSGTLTIMVDGEVIETANSPFNSPYIISLLGFTADGAQHTLTASFSADPSCQSSLDYTAPVPCGTTDCTVSVTAIPGDCEPTTNRYDLSGQISFTDAPATGTLTVSVGAFSRTYNAPFTSPINYTITDLFADGSQQTVEVSFSADAACRNTTDYIAPIGCDPVECSVGVIANVGDCESGTNTYDISGTITFVNPPATGTLTVSAGGQSQVFNAPFNSSQAYTLNGLVSDGAEHTVTAAFSEDVTCTAEYDFDAPDDCSPAICATSLEADPSPCSDGEYTLSGTVTFASAPTTGNLILREGAVDLLIIPMSASVNSPLNFNLPGLPADGSNHTLELIFSEDLTCGDDYTYTAPETCAGACDVDATLADIECNLNQSIIDGTDNYITFSLNPTGTNLGAAYNVGASSGSVFLLNGSPATNIPYGVPTTFRMQNGSAGGGNVNITVSDATNPSCSDTELLIDPGSCELDLFFDLALRKVINTSATPGPYHAGDDVTFTIEVINQGLIDAENIQITDHYPAELIPNDGNWTFNNGVATYNTPIDLVQQTSTTIDITFTINEDYQGLSLRNWAEISAVDENEFELDDIDSTPDAVNFNQPGETDDLNDDNDVNGNGKQGGDEDDHDPAEVPVEQVFDLALFKVVSSNGPFEPGDNVDFAMLVYNQGTVDATNVQVTDYIPDGLTLNDPDWMQIGNEARMVTPFPELLAGEFMSLTISFTIDSDYQGASIRNWAEISSVENANDMDDVDSTPDDTNFNQPGENNDLDDDDTINEDGKNGGDEDDHDPAELQVNQTFDLALTKIVDGAGPFVPGETVTFNIEVFNQGSIDATNVQVSDYIPSGLVLNDNNWVDNGGIATLITPIPTIAPGASMVRTITFTIDPNFSGAMIRNWAEISDADNALDLDDEDSMPDNTQFNNEGETDDLADDDVIDEDGKNGGDEDDHDPAEIMVQQMFDLALFKTESSSGPYMQGSTVSFVIFVENQGSLVATDVQITDYIPAGFILEDPNWTDNNGKATLKELIASITPGNFAARSITFRIADDYQGTSIRNWAEISAAQNEPNAEDIDSTPDDINFNQPGETDDLDDDDMVDEDGKNGGDEDDHDPVEILVEQTFDLGFVKSGECYCNSRAIQTW